MKQINTQEILEELRKKITKDLNETQVIELRNTYINKYVNPIYQELKLAKDKPPKGIGHCF